MNVTKLRMPIDLLYLFIILLFPIYSHASPKLEEAKNAYQRLQIPKAESIYKTILNDKEASKEGHFEALVGLARVKQLMGDTIDAKFYLKEAIKLAPWKRLPKEEFPPSFIKMHDELRKKELVNTGSLAITTDPPFVELKIEDIKLGFSPITIPEIPLGTYKIEASMPGYSKKSDSVTITKGGKKLLALNLEPETFKESEVVQKSSGPKNRENSTFLSQSYKIQNKPSRNNSAWWTKPWVWGASLIAVGGVAAYLFSQSGSSTPQNGAVSISLP